jgi:carbamate kinase
MTILVAVGKSAFVLPRDVVSDGEPRRSVRRVAQAIAPMAREHALVVTCGAGPQEGLLALEAAAVAHQVERCPLGLHAAQLEATLVAMLEQELRVLLPDRVVATVSAAAVVDSRDEAFKVPTLPVGPAYLRSEADLVAQREGWVFTSEGPTWRRVVPRPDPHGIVETRAIEHLLRAGAVVIASGGGGLPVIRSDDAPSALTPANGVVDSDLAAAALAEALDADVFVMLSDADAVYVDWGTPRQRAIRCAPPDALSDRLFHGASIAPKIAAGCRFAALTGRPAVIGSPGDLTRLIDGQTGTTISPAISELVFADVVPFVAPTP